MILKFIRQHPFVRLLCFLVIGIVLGDSWPLNIPFAWLLVLFFLLWLSYFLSRKIWIPWLFGVAVHLFFLMVGYAAMSRVLFNSAYSFTSGREVYLVRLLSEPQEKPKTFLLKAQLLSLPSEAAATEPSHPRQVLLYIAKDSLSASLKPGQELFVRAQLTASKDNRVAGFDYPRYLLRHRVAGTGYIPRGQWKVVGFQPESGLATRMRDLRDRTEERYRQLGFEGDEGAVLRALTLGEKEELSEEVKETYSVAGASHVLALSGLHIGFLYALFWFLFAPVWKRWSIFKPFLLVAIILIMWLFAYLVGLSSSVVRAVIMATVFTLAALMPEKPQTMNTLALTAFLMLLVKPEWLFDVGFQLSFSAVAAILLLQPKLSSFFQTTNPVFIKIRDLFTVSVAAQIGTAPIVAFYFHRFSCHFLLSNLWVIPLVSVILYLAVFMLLLFPFPEFQQQVGGVLRALIHYQNAGLQRIADLPFATIEGLNPLWIEVLWFYLLLYLFYRAWHVRTARNIQWFLGSVFLLAAFHSITLWVE